MMTFIEKSSGSSFSVCVFFFVSFLKHPRNEARAIKKKTFGEMNGFSR